MAYFFGSSATQSVWPKSHTAALNAYYFETLTLRSRCTICAHKMVQKLGVGRWTLLTLICVI